jgi:hypothetical protein
MLRLISILFMMLIANHVSGEDYNFDKQSPYTFDSKQEKSQENQPRSKSHQKRMNFPEKQNHSLVLSKSHKCTEACSQDLERARSCLMRHYPLFRKEFQTIFHEYPSPICNLSYDSMGIVTAYYQLHKQNQPEEMNILFQDPQLVSSIFQKLKKFQNYRASQHSLIAVRLANAFVLQKNNKKKREREMRKWQEAIQRDGRQTQIYKKISSKNLDHLKSYQVNLDSLWKKLKKHPAEFQSFLNLLTHMKWDELKTISNLPNAMDFLLNTGKRGYKLIKEIQSGNSKEKMGIFLLWAILLEPEEQLHFVKLNQNYPILLKIIFQELLAGYIYFKTYPQFSNELILKLLRNGMAEDKAILAWRIFLDRNVSYWKSDQMEKWIKRGHLTSSIAQIFLFPGSKETPPGLDLINDRYLLPLLNEFDYQGGLQLYKKYGAFGISYLIMHDWFNFEGDPRRKTGELAYQTIKKYGYVGLSAVSHFRYDEELQKEIVKEMSVKNQIKMLMVLSYYKADPGIVDDVRERREDKLTEFVLNKQGVPQEEGTSPGEFAPGYDIFKLSKVVVQGHIPKFDELGWAVFDAASIIIDIMTFGSATVATASAKGAAKAGLKGGKVAVKSLSKANKFKTGKFMKIIPKNLRKMKIVDFFKFKGVGFQRIKQVAPPTLRKPVKNVIEIARTLERYTKITIFMRETIPGLNRKQFLNFLDKPIDIISRELVASSVQYLVFKLLEERAKLATQNLGGLK